MIRLKLFRSLIVAACLPLLFVTTAAAQNYDIVPGRRIGKVEIGMSRQLVYHMLGKPTGTYRLRPRGYTGEYWILLHDDNNWERIFFDRSGRVYQMSVTSPRLILPGGLSVDSSIDEVRRYYRRLKELHFATRRDADYYDAAQQGIAFEFRERVDSRNVSSYEMYGVFVHKRGGSVLPEPDEQPR